MTNKLPEGHLGHGIGPAPESKIDHNADSREVAKRLDRASAAKRASEETCLECGGRNGQHQSYFQPDYGCAGQGFGEVHGTTRKCSKEQE